MAGGERTAVALILAFAAAFFASYNIVANVVTLHAGPATSAARADEERPFALGHAVSTAHRSEVGSGQAAVVPSGVGSGGGSGLAASAASAKPARAAEPARKLMPLPIANVASSSAAAKPAAVKPVPVLSVGGLGGKQAKRASAEEEEQCETEECKTEACNVNEHAEMWGDVVMWGTQHRTNSALECCAACRYYVPENGGKKCNTWVWCPNPEGCSGQPGYSCWLKNQPRPEAPSARRGKDVPWTSGSFHSHKQMYNGEPGKHRKYHIAVTSNASKYVQWQMRVMYYWYKKRLAEDTVHGQMGAFTRVLHDKPDHLMDEIPTCVVDRLKNEMGFVVLSRPQAFVQFLERCTVEEDYILMAEPDHLMLAPLPNLMVGNRAAAFPFFYIVPKDHPALIRKYTGPISDDELAAMDPIGNSPVFIGKEDLRRVAPIWANVTVRMKQDKEADKAWGWVLEMYGYTVAAKLAGVEHDLHNGAAQRKPAYSIASSNFCTSLPTSATAAPCETSQSKQPSMHRSLLG
mmetsp:Transcript_23437/g.76276  ORF Transcript_23437/g.76276 Transcript_23437/m.76276 type:complete len:519 (+) Transcript_23437:33-1589(+)